ncbi:MAG: tyrosine-type recombinase/integrase, partial [Acidimicrobiales bacterium]
SVTASNGDHHFGRFSRWSSSRPHARRERRSHPHSACRATRPSLVSESLRRVCLRCGIEVIGAHRLRHGLATEMLRQGASLIEVGQVLRHRDIATTAIYANSRELHQTGDKVQVA